MNTNVKAVINLMQTLGVTLKELEKELMSQPKKDEITYGFTSYRREYAKYRGKVLGLVFRSSKGDFILSLHSNGRNIEIFDAEKQAYDMEAPAGKHWEVPEDWHFRTIIDMNLTDTNQSLKELGGDMMQSKAYLSATSQHNRPSSWEVRFILPL